jgi:hypothetical protein
MPIVIVSGLPRSGTSLMMRMLEAGGIAPICDGLRTPDIDNPRGYYEDERVKKLADDDSWLDQAGGKAVKVISALLRHLPDRHDYKVVFMRRDLDEVLASQARMLERRGAAGGDESVLRRAFMGHLEQVERLLDEREIDVLFVSYSRLVTDPDPQLDRIVRFLAGLDRASMAAVIEPDLYRRRKAGLDVT